MRGKCPDCGAAMVEENGLQLNAKSGPFYDHWLRRSYMATHRALLDAQRAEP